MKDPCFISQEAENSARSPRLGRDYEMKIRVYSAAEAEMQA